MRCHTSFPQAGKSCALMIRKQYQHRDILVASPGDAGDYREIARRVIGEWNTNNKSSEVHLNFLGWENAGLNNSSSIQDLLNSQLLGEADYAIVVFHSRIGTETENYVSGTVEELQRLTQAGKVASIYFSNKPIRNPDPAQYQAVLDLKKELRRKKIAVREFDTDEEFRAHLTRDLNHALGSVPHLYAGTRLDPEFDSNFGAPVVGHVRSAATAQAPVVDTLPAEGVRLLKLWKENVDQYALAGQSGAGYYVQLGEVELTDSKCEHGGASWDRAINRLTQLGIIHRTSGKPGVQPYKLTVKGVRTVQALSS